MPVNLYGYSRYRMSDSSSSVTIEGDNQLLVLDTKIQQIKNELSSIRNTLSSNIQDEVTAARETLLELLQKLENELQSVISMYSNLVTKNDLTLVQNIISTLQNEIKGTNGELEGKLLELQKSLEIIQGIIETLKTQISNNPSQQDILQLNDIITKLQSDFDVFQNETTKLKEDITNLPVYTDVTEINEKLKEFETLLNSVSEITNIKIELQNLQKIINNIPLQSLQEDLARINKKLQGFDLPNDLISLQHIIQTIQTDLSRLQESTPKQSDIQVIRESLTNLVQENTDDISEIQSSLTSIQETINVLPNSQEVETLKNIVHEIQKTLEDSNIQDIKKQLETLQTSTSFLPTSEEINDIRGVLTNIETELKQTIKDHSKFISVTGVNEILNGLKDTLKNLENSTLTHQTLISEIQKHISDLETKHTAVTNILNTLPTKYVGINEFRNVETKLQLMPTITQLWEVQDGIKNLVSISDFQEKNTVIEGNIGALETRHQELATKINKLHSVQYLRIASIPNKEREFKRGHYWTGKSYLFNINTPYFRIPISGKLIITGFTWLKKKHKEFPILDIYSQDGRNWKDGDLELGIHEGARTLDAAELEITDHEFIVVEGDILIIRTNQFSPAEYPILVDMLLYTPILIK